VVGIDKKIPQEPESLSEIKANWEEFARSDPLWSILPLPEKKGNRWSIDELFKTGETEIDGVIDYLRAKKIRFNPEKVLDFGCGVGRLTQAFARHFEKSIGLDISAGMIELANRYNRFGTKCQYLVNTTNDLKIFDRDTFDMIYSNIVFQHIPPVFTRAYLKEFLRVIKPQGIIVFQVAVEEIPFAGTRLRNIMKNAVPKALRRIYKKIKYGSWAIKDMYCMPQHELDGFITANGGKIVDAVEDRSTMPRYRGLRYCVKRQHSGEEGMQGCRDARKQG